MLLTYIHYMYAHSSSGCRLRGAFCQFPFRWIYYCHSSESTGKETGKTHLCEWCNAYTKSRILAYEDLALQCCSVQTASFFSAASTSGLDYGAQGATMRAVARRRRTQEALRTTIYGRKRVRKFCLLHHRSTQARCSI